MLRRLLAVVLMLGSAVLGGTSPANAFSLPCMGESVIKVMDVRYPAIVEGQTLLRLKEQKLHLGYVFRGCFTGEWVGYAGTGNSYVNLSERQLREMLALVRLDAPPPAPSFWSSPENYQNGVAWMILGLVFVIAAVLQQMGVLVPKPKDDETERLVAPVMALAKIPVAGPAEAASAQMPPSFKSALTAVERAASEHGRFNIAGQLKSEQAAPTAAPAAPQSSTFGKR